MATIERVRQRLVEEGRPAALHRRPSAVSRQRTWDGEPEASLIALTCSQVEEGQRRWTLPLRADTLGELRMVERISRETVRQVLSTNERKPWLKEP